jgi:hypothetical protein
MLGRLAGLYSVRRIEADMRAYTNVLKALALLAWSAASLGQQQGTPPAPQQPAPRTEAPAPAAPPAAEPETTAPPREAAGNADEGEFIPTEELAPDAAITFPVNI